MLYKRKKLSITFGMLEVDKEASVVYRVLIIAYYI